MSTLLQRKAARVQLTPKQANIFCWGWQPEAKMRVAVCGRRFGKTFLMMEELRRAVRLAVERNIDTDNEIWYGAPTYKQAHKNFWKRAIRATPPEWIAHIDNARTTITYHSGHVFRLVGLDNYNDLRGSGLYFFMGDEWADVKPEAWGEVIEPMLATCDGGSIFIGTPKGYDDFYDKWARGQAGDGKHKSTMSWRYSTLDGGNVTAEWLDEKRATTDARIFGQEYLADFVTHAGRIYYGFDRSESIKPPPWGNSFASNRLNVSPFYNPSLPLHVGLDFNIDPMTAHIYQEVVIKDATGQARIVSYQIDEIHIFSSNTHEIAAEISTRYANKDVQKPHDHITIYPDPAGAGRRTAAHGLTDVSILRQAGFHVYAMSTHPLVRDRINLVNGKLQAANSFRSLFIAPNCKKSIESIEKQEYKVGTSEPDKNSGYDHDNDALGYYVYTRFAHQKPRVETVAHMGR